MKTNLRERLTRYQCVIRPKVHFAPELSFKARHYQCLLMYWSIKGYFFSFFRLVNTQNTLLSVYFYYTLSICVCRFQLEYVSLKAVRNLHLHFSSFTFTLQFYLYLYSEGFFIYHSPDLYHILFLKHSDFFQCFLIYRAIK